MLGWTPGGVSDWLAIPVLAMPKALKATATSAIQNVGANEKTIRAIPISSVVLMAIAVRPVTLPRWAMMKPANIAPNPMADVIHASPVRSEEHTSELQSLMRTSYAFFCL